MIHFTNVKVIYHDQTRFIPVDWSSEKKSEQERKMKMGLKIER